MSQTIYLVTGANRGIGLGLVTTLLTRPNTTVIATVRNPASASNISELPTASNSKVIVVKLDSTVHTDAAAIVEEVQSKHGITKLDVVIANAGVSDHYAPAAKSSAEEARRHMNINYVAPLALFGATVPLLEKSSNPRFVGISSGAASIGDLESMPLQCTVYGASKAALNYALRKAHFENPKITIYPLSPGWVKTDMGNLGAKSAGMEEAHVELQDSVKGILNNIDNATKEQTSGTFQDFEGKKFAW